MPVYLTNPGIINNLCSKINDFKPMQARWSWILQLQGMYVDEVKKAMGSVDAVGGYMRLNFMGMPGRAYWKNLSPATLEEYSGGHAGGYDEVKWDFKIWNHTGRTRNNVKTTGNFSGILGGDDIARIANLIERGGTSERGIIRADGSYSPPGEIPPRPLFAVANEALRMAVHHAFASNGQFTQDIIRELKLKIKWGESTIALDDTAREAAIAKMIKAQTADAKYTKATSVSVRKSKYDDDYFE